jgi:hypothetical protein
MLEPDKWDAVLSRITGTVYRDEPLGPFGVRFSH